MNKKISIKGCPEILLNQSYTGLSREELISNYWRHHPRFRFLKMSKLNAKLFDIGAGSGGLTFWKDWETPKRPDLEIHGCDLYRSKNSERYKQFTELNIDQRDFPYAAFFDAVLTSHVIEHLNDIKGFAKKISAATKIGGLLYVETPSVSSVTFPKRDEFLAEGISTTTINFFDDDTHTKPVSREDIISNFKLHGFIEFESGTIMTPFLEDPMIAHAYWNKDEELGGYGLWSKLGFAHYVILKKTS